MSEYFGGFVTTGLVTTKSILGRSSILRIGDDQITIELRRRVSMPPDDASWTPSLGVEFTLDPAMGRSWFGFRYGRRARWVWFQATHHDAVMIRDDLVRVGATEQRGPYLGIMTLSPIRPIGSLIFLLVGLVFVIPVQLHHAAIDAATVANLPANRSYGWISQSAIDFGLLLAAVGAVTLVASVVQAGVNAGRRRSPARTHR